MSSVPFKYHWHYKGKTKYDHVRLWCRNNFGPEGPTAGRWQTAPWETFYFTDLKDYNWFVLRWHK